MSERTERTERLAAVVVPVALLALDRTAKWYATAALPPQGLALVPGIRFFYFENPGLIFSLSVSAVSRTVSVLALIALGVAAFVMLVRSPRHITVPRTLAAVMLIALGGLSNVYDRLSFGAVTDYVLFFNRSAVNLADGMILAGIVLLFLKKKTRP